MFKKLVWDNNHGGYPSAEAGFLARYWTLENNDDTWTVWLGSVKCGQIMFKATAATLEEAQEIAEEDFQKRLAGYCDDSVFIMTLSENEAKKLADKLEWAAIWDKVGDVYYQLKSWIYAEPSRLE